MGDAKTAQQNGVSDDAAPDRKPLGTRISAVVHDRAQNAFWATRVYPEDAKLTWQDFVEEAVRAHTRHLEEKHNGGQPFPQRPGKLPGGRIAGM